MFFIFSRFTHTTEEINNRILILRIYFDLSTKIGIRIAEILLL